MITCRVFLIESKQYRDTCTCPEVRISFTYFKAMFLTADTGWFRLSIRDVSESARTYRGAHQTEQQFKSYPQKVLTSVNPAKSGKNEILPS